MIKYKSSRLCFVMVVILSVVSVRDVYAQISDSLKTELKKRSDAAYHIGSNLYVSIDAVCDGYLRPNEKYTMKWKEGELWLNDKEMPKRYATKLKAFYKENYRRANNDFYTSATVPGTEALLKDGSLAQTYIDNIVGVNTGGSEQPSKTQSKKIIQALVSMVATDSLTDTAKYFALQFDAHGLVINGKKADNITAAKYAKALKKDGIDIDRAGASIWYNNNYRKQW